ncbi:carboxypeptidase regulatory-like domain-containing protein, partial [Candidatus Woesearchaeota archaeon]|nr:carboxypeptidase regulatory-like domain-containing protein [Candidatus Woesearchaeota archaeon]
MIGNKRGLFIVVLGIFLLSFLFVSSVDTDGCYVYPESGSYCQTVSQSDAETDCAEYGDCSLDQHYVPLQDCSGVDVCQLVVCDLDCTEKTLGECRQEGIADTGVAGGEVPLERYNELCTPGCCILDPSVGENQCQFPLFKRECSDLAARRGFNSDFRNPSGMSYSQCQLECSTEIVGSDLIITVLSEDGTELSGVTVKILGTEEEGQTLASGEYTFPTLQPSTYVVKVSKDTYKSAVASISVEGESVSHQFILTSSVGTRSISGTVKDETGEVLEGAKVSIQESTEPAITIDDGTYKIENIPSGVYTVTASKEEYSTQSKQVTVPEDTDVTGIDFTLIEQVENGVTIKVVNNAEGQPGAKVYINGTFRGITQYPEGETNIISLTPQEGGQDYEVFATFQEYGSNPVIFSFGPTDASITIEVNLILPETECNCEADENKKPVTEFLVSPVLGKEQLKLTWTKPCAEVTSYTIQRTGEDDITDPISVSGAVVEHVDVDVEWEKTYSYTITANYEGGQCSSSELGFDPITMGMAACEDRYTESAGWDTFCQSDIGKRQQVFRCTNSNTIEPILSADCSVENKFCTQTSRHSARCSDNAMCTTDPMFGNPFGLYYSEDICYGPQDNPNYCYYDNRLKDTGKITTVDVCNNCEDVDTCFDYQSEGACTQNRCFGTPCEWVDGASQPEEPLLDYTIVYGNYNQDAKFVTAETGAGYCVEENYDENTQCTLCGPDSPLFENYYCTANVCSGLGSCFSQENLNKCNECPDVPDDDSTCYDFITEQECTNGQPLTNIEGTITLSQDSCTWGRCSWTNPGGNGQCIKDGDGDHVDDCVFTPNEFGAALSQQVCARDITPPRTILSQDVHVVSTATPEITFFGSDAYGTPGQGSVVETLSYCITNIDVDTCTLDKYIDVAYAPNVDQDTLITNVLDSGFLDASIDGDVYKIKFFSTDIYHNQESVNEEFIYVDTTIPPFTIHDEQIVNIDLVDLTVYLEDTNEPMSCEFVLQPIFPSGEALTASASREDNVKDATFSTLPGIRYDVTVTCTDDYGNVNEKTEQYVLNHDQRITVVRPALKENLATTSVVFEVRTGVGATCELFNTATNQLVPSPFSTSDEKTHITEPVSGFSDGQYAAVYKAKCTELLTNDVAEAYFDFAIDFTPPKTSITLQEGGRTSSPTSFGWEEVFIETVDVTLTCETDGGFDCATTSFCLGTGCDYINNPNYIEYTEPFILEESTEICYYSTDTVDNPFPEIMCGTITIDGYGITLVTPEPYTYDGETWGISNTQVFDWTFYTKVPTRVCKFDFRSGTLYEEIEQFKTLSIIDGKYTFEKFPGDTISAFSDSGSAKTVYIQCENEVGEVGPEHVMNLEYDPSKPDIKDAYADPDNVVEGISTNIFVETDDKTLCKYSDNSDDAGTKDYFAMEYSFPGTTEKELFTDHDDEFSINFLGTTKKYSLLTQCMNGAGDISEVETIEFDVDYSIIGNILTLSPQNGYFSASDMTLYIETNKNALCEYELDTIIYPFTETGGKVHTSTLTELGEGEYIIPVKCVIGEHTAESTIMFTIDQTPPTITQISDGNYTCGSDVISIFVTTDEEVITGYSYELYDDGVIAHNINATAVGPGGKVLEATVGPGMPINISTETLIENHTYSVKLYTWDEAGNTAQISESDGVTIINENHSICFMDTTAPSVTMISLNTISCTRVGVSLDCTDETSCSSFEFSQSYSSDECTENRSYAGQNILFNRTGWVCYSVSDPLGNSIRSVDTVEFDDADGDGIVGRCD